VSRPRWANAAKPTRIAAALFIGSDSRLLWTPAVRAFQVRGYEATSIRVIAEKLNTDRASIYYYFGSKQELFRAIVRDVAQKRVKAAEIIAAKEASAEKKLREAFQSVLETYSSSYPYMHVFHRENIPVVRESRVITVTPRRVTGADRY